MYEFVKVGINDDDHKNHAEFLAKVFNKRKIYTKDYIKGNTQIILQDLY